MKTVIFLLALLMMQNVNAKIVLPDIISDNMVLQQNTVVKLWGKANPNQKVSIKASWNNKRIRITAGADGKWLVKLQTPSAGGPYTILFSDNDSKMSIANILIGEVWFCGGQSNMEWPICGNINQPVENSLKTILEADPAMPIRLLTVKRNHSRVELDRCEGKWQLNKPANVSNFSATAYFYGRYLQKILKVPIGLIVSPMGGSRVEAWIDAETLGAYKEFDLSLLQKKEKLKTIPQHTPTVFYNAMVAPIINYTVAGAIWYQGEANRNNTKLYRKLMVSYVEMMRKKWGKALPFYYAQIAPWTYDGIDLTTSAKVRETQMQNLSDIPNCGMAVTMDIGGDNQLHPPKKKEVGERLAYWALANNYGIKGFAFSGPIYKSMEVKKDKIHLKFDYAEKGFCKINNKVATMEIAGDDKIFYPATVSIGQNLSLIVSSNKVPNPIAVRYGFKNLFEGDLFNTAGLPASSFRTDDWE